MHLYVRKLLKHVLNFGAQLKETGLHIVLHWAWSSSSQKMLMLFSSSSIDQLMFLERISRVI